MSTSWQRNAGKCIRLPRHFVPMPLTVPMAEGVYVLSALTSIACVLMLVTSYRKQRVPLLFWSSLCFAFFAVNNLFLLGDLIFSPESDFSIPRNLSGVIGTSLLLYGMLWVPGKESDRRP